MLKTKKVDISWYYKTKKHYQNKGYIFSIFGDKFNVNIEDLHEGASVEIEIKCDYCGEVFNRRYCDHIKIIKKELLITKDSCVQCKDLKKREILECKQKNSQLTKDIDGYWTFKENRLKELDAYIKKAGHLNSISNDKEGFVIYSNFLKNNHQVIDGVIELGYTPRKLYTRMPEGYYDDFEKVKELISEFISQYGKFPTMSEMRNEFNLDGRHITKHGGVYGIKRKMGYVDSEDLMDDNNYYNNSAYEYFVAQYLIYNNINYKREQYPFPDNEGRYRSDFTLCPAHGKEVHVEVWGMEESESYKITMKKKLNLYEKYNIPLISIHKSMFDKKKLNETQLILFGLFSNYLNIEYKEINHSHLVNPLHLTDDELFETLINLSKDGITLPTTSYLKKIKHYGIYNQVIKRYGHYSLFAKKYSVTNEKKKYYWTENEIKEHLDKLVSENKRDISRKTIEELKINGLVAAIERSGGFFKHRIEYYLRNDVESIHEKDLKFFNNVIDNKGTNIKNKVTPEQQEQAKQILEKYNINKLNTSQLG